MKHELVDGLRKLETSSSSWNYVIRVQGVSELGMMLSKSHEKLRWSVQIPPPLGIW